MSLLFFLIACFFSIFRVPIDGFLVNSRHLHQNLGLNPKDTAGCNIKAIKVNRHSIKSFNTYSSLRMTNEVTEFGDEDFDTEYEEDAKTHGYEGDFKVGDVVRVANDIRIWSVKAYSKEGFIAKGFVGKVTALLLYGRKHGTLCSAITPIKVEFEPDGEGIPQNMFEKKWIAHFAADELEFVR